MAVSFECDEALIVVGKTLRDRKRAIIFILVAFLSGHFGWGITIITSATVVLTSTNVMNPKAQSSDLSTLQLSNTPLLACPSLERTF